MARSSTAKTPGAITNFTPQPQTDLVSLVEQKRTRRPGPNRARFYRATYQVTEEVHNRVKEIAEEQELTPSDIVRFALRRFLEGYEVSQLEGSIVVEKTKRTIL